MVQNNVVDEIFNAQTSKAVNSAVDVFEEIKTTINNMDDSHFESYSLFLDSNRIYIYGNTIRRKNKLDSKYKNKYTSMQPHKFGIKNPIISTLLEVIDIDLNEFGKIDEYFKEFNDKYYLIDEVKHCLDEHLDRFYEEQSIPKDYRKDINTVLKNDKKEKINKIKQELEKSRQKDREIEEKKKIDDEKNKNILAMIVIGVVVGVIFALGIRLLISK